MLVMNSAGFEHIIILQILKWMIQGRRASQKTTRKSNPEVLPRKTRGMAESLRKTGS
jgi:hypothetical protein